MSQTSTDPTAPAPMPGATPTPDGFAVFTLRDADGAPHRYEVRPHPATEGLDVMLALVALGAEPLARVVQSALAVEDIFAEGASLGDALDIDLEALVGKIAWGDVGADVKRSILDLPPALVRNVLRYTWRDGRELTNDIHYNAAYSANYLELMQAAWEVSQVNRFFPRLSTSKEGRAQSAATTG